MKTLIRTAFAVALMFTSTMSYSNHDTALSNYGNERPSIMVKKGQTMQIKNAVGTVIYSEAISYDGKLATTFDLSTLRDGYYTLELIKAFEINIKKFEVDNHNVSYFENGESTLYKPVFRKTDNKIYVSQLSFDPLKWDLELYFDNELIHTEEATGTPVLERIYVLGENVQGNYKVVLKSNNRIYEETFKS